MKLYELLLDIRKTLNIPCSSDNFGGTTKDTIKLLIDICNNIQLIDSTEESIAKQIDINQASVLFHQLLRRVLLQSKSVFQNLAEYKSALHRLMQCIFLLDSETFLINDTWYIKGIKNDVKVTKWISASRALFSYDTNPYSKQEDGIMRTLTLTGRELGTVMNDYKILSQKTEYRVTKNITDIYDRCLHKSCLNNGKGEGISDSLVFYESMDNCRILYGKRGDNIVSRALMWQLLDGTWYVDRIYDYTSGSKNNDSGLNLGTMVHDIITPFDDANKSGQNDFTLTFQDEFGNDYVISDCRMNNGSSSVRSFKSQILISPVKFNKEIIVNKVLPLYKNENLNGDDDYISSMFPYSDTYAMVVGRTDSITDPLKYNIRFIALNYGRDNAGKEIMYYVNNHLKSSSFVDKLSQDIKDYLSKIHYLSYSSYERNTSRSIGRSYSFLPITTTCKYVDFEDFDSYEVFENKTCLKNETVAMIDLTGNITHTKPLQINETIAEVLCENGTYNNLFAIRHHVIVDVLGNNIMPQDALRIVSNYNDSFNFNYIIVHKAILDNNSDYKKSVLSFYDEDSDREFTSLSEFYDKIVPVPSVISVNDIIAEVQNITLKSIAAKEGVVESICGNILIKDSVKIFEDVDYPNSRNLAHKSQADTIRMFLNSINTNGENNVSDRN